MKSSSSTSRLLSVLVLATFLLPVASVGSVVWHLARHLTRDGGHHAHHVHHLHSAPEAVSGFAVTIGHADGHAHDHDAPGGHEEHGGHDDGGRSLGEADEQEHHGTLRARLENPPRTATGLAARAFSTDSLAPGSRDRFPARPPAPPPRSLFASHCALLL